MHNMLEIPTDNETAPRNGRDSDVQRVFGRLLCNDRGLDIILLKKNGLLGKLRYLRNRFVERKEIANSLRRWLDFCLNNSGCDKTESP